MALTITPSSLFLILVTIFSDIHFSSSSKIELNSDRLVLPIDVHDLLPQYGFPRGLLPNNIKSYSLSDDGEFEVELESPCYVVFDERTCYVEFDEVIYYDQKIRGHLTYGSISNLTGILCMELFLWFPVTHIDSDQILGCEDVPVCTKPKSI